MNILEINACLFGSTGSVMRGVASAARDAGHTVYVAVPDSRDNRSAGGDEWQIFIGTRLSRNLHRTLAERLGLDGRMSGLATRRLIRFIKEREISLVHLHNIHGRYLNYKLLFNYFKKNDIRVIWTLHDCWSFTGHCPHFDAIGCDRWQTGCHSCPQHTAYPESRVDDSARLYKLKKECFTGLQSLTIVTPSHWLSALVGDSMLGGYERRVIHNGIDLSVFKPTDSDFKARYGIEGKKMVLGVAFTFDERKGLDSFIELRKRLGDDYAIVLVGEIEGELPDGIISIKRTANRQELAEIYTAADVFVNPTIEDNFPTVNLEALATGTPVVTYNTGGSPECIDGRTGAVVAKGCVDELAREVRRTCEGALFTAENCIERAGAFDKNDRFNEYLKLFEI